MQAYSLIKTPKNPKPILISIPHCGRHIPQQCRHLFNKENITKFEDDDTDIDKIYNNFTSLGINIIKANYSRSLIDLNRPPNNEILYKSRTFNTTLIPTQTFFGKPLYKQELHPQEIEDRKKIFHQEYHNKLSSLLVDLRKQFNNILLFEAHSIRSHLPLIQEEPFKDLTIGTQDDTSASQHIISAMKTSLETSPYQTSSNTPFKGGYITRNYANPEQGIHTIQLEITKKNYMSNNETSFDQEKSKTLIKTLTKMFKAILLTLEKL